MTLAQTNWIFRFSLLVSAIAWQTSLAAQNQPQFIQVSPDELNFEQRVPCNNDAGEINNFGPFIGESNDAVPDTIYLCFGDSIFVNHNEISINLSGDPVPGTD
ncbi:MAG: hypothetical protein AAFN65_05180, partial [Bacteroidota bacterium]